MSSRSSPRRCSGRGDRSSKLSPYSDTIGAPENPSQPAEPLTYWHHTDPTLSAIAHTTGRAPSGIAFYTGDTYPPEYRGACFIVDSVGGWIKALVVDNSPVIRRIVGYVLEAEGCAAGKRRTGMETRPKEMVPVAIGRAGMARL